MGAEVDGYVLGRTEAEYERLRLQAQNWAPVTQRVLERAGLGPGMRCLDVGCGPGEVMRLMGRMVGPTGHVTGVDVDAALGAHTLAEIEREQGPRFAFVAADVSRGLPQFEAPFDLVFARLLLIHMTDPVSLVRSLAAKARPGGRLALMDYDLTRMTERPEHPALARAREITVACFERGGKHADCGLRLADYLDAAGLPPPDGSEVAGIYESVATRGAMLRAALTSVAPAAAALGVATANEIEALQAEIGDLEAQDRRFCLGPLMIGVWTTIPG